MNLFKSVLHNIGVVAVGFVVALLGVALDRVLGLRAFGWPQLAVIGWVLVAMGFLLRVWAAHEFYERRMKVIVLVPQGHLVTTGPYEFTRNPLYVGGNVFIFLGACLILGTPGGCIVTLLHLPLVHWMIRREEAQLERVFGEEWRRYSQRVRRWV
jgi:protein-S-isoprenylcysteine O-methyltransferase Ste14